MFFNPYWPLATLEFADKTRQAALAGLQVAACFNPALAWWLATFNPAQGKKA